MSKKRKREGGVLVPTKREIAAYQSIIARHAAQGYRCHLLWDWELDAWCVVCDPIPAAPEDPFMFGPGIPVSA